MRCEGYRRYGGALSFGPPVWKQCENEATVIIEVEQGGEKQTLPGCPTCWQEAIDKGITILSVKPVSTPQKDGEG